MDLDFKGSYEVKGNEKIFYFSSFLFLQRPSMYTMKCGGVDHRRLWGWYTADGGGEGV